jgi:hypothetical protein
MLQTTTYRSRPGLFRGNSHHHQLKINLSFTAAPRPKEEQRKQRLQRPLPKIKKTDLILLQTLLKNQRKVNRSELYSKITDHEQIQVLPQQLILTLSQPLRITLIFHICYITELIHQSPLTYYIQIRPSEMNSLPSYDIRKHFFIIESL